MSIAFEEQQGGLFKNINNHYNMMMMKRKQQQQPTNFLNSLFMSTVNMATNMLLSVVSKNYALNFPSSFSPSSFIIPKNNKWSVKDHLRFMSLLFTWFAMWALRLISDFIPSSSSFLSFLSSHTHTHTHTHNHNQLTTYGSDNGVTTTYSYKKRNNQMQQQYRVVGDEVDGSSLSSSSLLSSSSSLDMVAVPSSSSSSLYSPVQNLDLICHDGFLMESYDHHAQAGQSVEALGRALSHVLALLNELPTTSRKYDFAIAMADRLLDENTRDGKVELLHVNRAALSLAFESTINRLYHTLNKAVMDHADQANNRGGPWSMRMIRKLPLGSYITAYMKGGISALIPALQSMSQLQKRRYSVVDDDDAGGDEYVVSDQNVEVVGAEKLAHELLWKMHKLRACHAIDEALVQWSLASNLASLSLNVNPRVQALLIKISASLLGDVARAEFKVHTQIQYRLLVLWLPLFCYSNNGLRYPVLSSYEKIDVERTMERMIAGLSAMEQEIVLRNWLQDFAICSSDWPNLRPSYDRWCQSSRQLVT